MSNINVILDDKEEGDVSEEPQQLVSESAQSGSEDLIQRLEKLDNFIKKTDIRIAKRQQEWERQASLSLQEKAKLKTGLGLYGFGEGKEA